MSKNKIPTQEDIVRLRDEGIRRALNTPPKKNKELVGITERAQYAKAHPKPKK